MVNPPGNCYPVGFSLGVSLIQAPPELDPYHFQLILCGILMICLRLLKLDVKIIRICLCRLVKTSGVYTLIISVVALFSSNRKLLFVILAITGELTNI